MCKHKINKKFRKGNKAEVTFVSHPPSQRDQRWIMAFFTRKGNNLWTEIAEIVASSLLIKGKRDFI